MADRNLTLPKGIWYDEARRRYRVRLYTMINGRSRVFCISYHRSLHEARRALDEARRAREATPPPQQQTNPAQVSPFTALRLGLAK